MPTEGLGIRIGESFMIPGHRTSQLFPPSRGRSLQHDLALGFGLGIMAVWLLALLVGWAVLRSEIDEIYDAALSRTADRLLALNGSQATTPRRNALLVEWISSDGTIRFRSSGVANGKNGGILAKATADGLVDTGDLRMPAALGAAFWFTRRRLKPVSELSREVAGRDARDLQPLSARILPLELEPIRGSVNQLMRQLDEALAAERAFSANAAHELRTPIASALAQVQRLIAEASTPELRARGEAVATALQRLSRLSAKLLDLARAEGIALQASEAHDMGPVLRLVASDYGDQVDVVIAADPVLLQIDVDAFAILARNLIENAVVHGQPPIRITLSRSALEVENAGPAVPAELLSTLTRRFHRGAGRPASLTPDAKPGTDPGAGLGLAIVDAVVKRMNAELCILSPARGRSEGFSIRVNFAPDAPAVAHPAVVA
jgi:two-component system OmpR family sensor kinase